MAALELHPFDDASRAWAANLHRERWASTVVVSRGKAYVAYELPGFVAYYDGQPVGVVTYHIEGDSCELLTLDSVVENVGVGSALIEAVKTAAREADCRRVWLITTNDNTRAMRFYQRRGLRFAALHRNSIEESRRLKPEIPLLGDDDIPIRDEIEFEIEV